MRVRSGWGYEASVEDVVVPGVLMEEENSYYWNTALKIIYGLCLGPPDLHRCRVLGSPLWYSKFFTSTAVEEPRLSDTAHSPYTSGSARTTTIVSKNILLLRCMSQTLTHSNLPSPTVRPRRTAPLRYLAPRSDPWNGMKKKYLISTI